MSTEKPHNVTQWNDIPSTDNQRYSRYDAMVFEPPLLPLPENMSTTNVSVQLRGRWVTLNIEPDAVSAHTPLSESLLSPFLVVIGILTLGVISS